MKRKIFLTSVTIVVLAIAVVGVNAYNYYSMPALMRANLEALADEEQPIKTDTCYLNLGIEHGQVQELLYFCHNKTSVGEMYKCLEFPTFGIKGEKDKCQKR